MRFPCPFCVAFAIQGNNLVYVFHYCRLGLLYHRNNGMIAFVFHFLDHLLCLSEIKLVYVLERNRIKREFVKITNGNDEMYT